MITELIDIVLHLDQHLGAWSQLFGPWLYVILAVIVFCETGLVVTPFLPGDSLLFAVGALCSLPDSAIRIGPTVLLLIVAAIIGDAVNYAIGRRIGPAIFSSETSRLLNKAHLLRAQAFYDRHGGKAIVIARFAPILRTFAPFVAGIGKMEYRRFAAYNVGGAIAWVATFALAGYQFGSEPVIKKNFHVVIVVIVILSLMPAVIEFVRARRAQGSPA